jgi:phosphohistidine swiveling domain-containing protein
VVAVAIRILRGAEALSAPAAGGKARALARAELGGLPVPSWFVVAAEGAGSADLNMDQSGASAIVAAAGALSADGSVLAVRSSALDEDGAGHSFAGQLESYLNVPADGVVEKVGEVWRSGFTERITAYRREHGLPTASSPPGVLVQRMVDARVAGVAFGADPVSGRRGVAVISALPGLGSALVSGEADGDTWHVDRSGTITERRIVPKLRKHAADPAAAGGVRMVDVPPDAAASPALSDAEVAAVAALVRKAGAHFGRPQDIEWAIADRLYLLQSRPITSLANLPDPDGPLVIWDNSNIVESYSGVTTPLTFSFAREIYEHVYRQFCRMMQVPEAVIDSRDEMFRNMLGLIRGRLYYNLLNWYRLLAMLPGYAVNRRFMEGMMGVKEPLPEELAGAIASEGSRGKFKDILHLARTLVALVGNHLVLNRRVDAFYGRLDRALVSPVPPLAERRVDELVAYYRDLRAQLLLRWDAPLVNDFFAMIFYGVLRSLVVRWCGDPGGTLQNDLIGGEGGIVSAEPAVRMQRLAALAATDGELLHAFRFGDTAAIAAALESRPAARAQSDEYLARFGDRTVNELKLESYTLHDDPLPLYRAVGSLAMQPSAGTATSTAADRLRIESRARVAGAMKGRPWRAAVFGWVLKHARRRVRDRENLRLERTRLFGRVRRIFLEIGHRLAAVDRLGDGRDVFYLEVDEVLAFADGRTTTTDLRGLVDLRKREFARYAAADPPDTRFQTRGAVHLGHDFRAATAPLEESGSDRTGLGCSPGVVRGPVRVVTDPTKVDPGHGAILVAEHTDPGWIMVFPSARGVLVERGSLLSHAAIVARELGIPAVVSLPGLTRWLRDGDVVEMDGSAGTVRKIVEPSGAVGA